MTTAASASPSGLEAAEARLEEVAPGYLTRVRVAAARIGRVGHASDGTELALADVVEAADVDVDVPTASRRRSGSVLKQLLKRLLGWYLRYLGEQVSVLGRATSELGRALAARDEELDGAIVAHSLELDRLRHRVERLEAREAAGE